MKIITKNKIKEKINKWQERKEVKQRESKNLK